MHNTFTEREDMRPQLYFQQQQQKQAQQK